MMRLGRVLAIGGSVALHAGALAGVLLLAASLRHAEPLFVDLTTGAHAGDERPALAPSSPGPTAAAAPAPRERDRARAGRAPLSVPTRPAEIAPAPEPLRPASSEEAVAVPAPRTAADPAADAVRSAPASAPAAGASTAVAPAATASTAVASDAATGTGQPSSAVGGGSRLALAGPGARRSELPAEFGPYLANFRQRIQELVVYPLAARRRGLVGRVEVEVVLEPTGRVRDAAVVASSTHSMLDEAALEAVKSLPPVPLPETLPRRPLRVRLPIVFDLR